MLGYISYKTRGSFNNFERWAKGSRNLTARVRKMIEPFAQEGVRALAEATPRDSSLAANSWDYKIESNSTTVTVIWTNRDVETGFPVAIALQYGYSTGTGGWVEGRDYINPALRPIFDRISHGIWKVVKLA